MLDTIIVYGWINAGVITKTLYVKLFLSRHCRCRLLFEVAEAVTTVVGPRRAAVRLSPTTIDPTTGRQNQVSRVVHSLCAGSSTHPVSPFSA